jgi:hypothetical protein
MEKLFSKSLAVRNVHVWPSPMHYSKKIFKIWDDYVYSEEYDGNVYYILGLKNPKTWPRSQTERHNEQSSEFISRVFCIL